MVNAVVIPGFLNSFSTAMNDIFIFKNGPDLNENRTKLPPRYRKKKITDCQRNRVLEVSHKVKAEEDSLLQSSPIKKIIE